MTLIHGILASKKNIVSIPNTLEVSPNSIEFNESGIPCGDNDIVITSNTSWSAIPSGAIANNISLDGGSFGAAKPGSGNDTITVTCNTGTVTIGSVFIQTVSGSPSLNANVSLSTGVGCT